MVLEAKFADFYDLPATGTVTIAGGTDVDYVGLGVAPEDFYVTGPEGTIFAQGELAILYVPVTRRAGTRRAARAGERPGRSRWPTAPTGTWWNGSWVPPSTNSRGSRPR